MKRFFAVPAFKLPGIEVEDHFGTAIFKLKRAFFTEKSEKGRKNPDFPRE